MQSLNVVITKKVNLEELLIKFQEKLKQYEETLEENEENEKILENV